MRLPKKSFAIFTAAYWMIAAIFIAVAAVNIRPVVNAASAPTMIWADYGYQPVHEDPLFNEDGTVNGHVLTALNTILEQMNEDAQFNNKGGWIETTSEHFSAKVTSTEDENSNVYGKATGAYIIRLFPTIATNNSAEWRALTDAEKRVNELANQWYQLVYRTQDSVAGGRDILTLWSLGTYRETFFCLPVNEEPNTDEIGRFADIEGGITTTENIIEYDWGYGPEYRTEYVHVSDLHGGPITTDTDYSSSIARHNMLSDYRNLVRYFSGDDDFELGDNNDFDKYFASSGNLPGNWQSSDNQSGAGPYEPPTYIYTVGAAGVPTSDSNYFHYPNYSTMYTINNGMDAAGGFSLEYIWQYHQSCYSDKIWLPSAFETVYMGSDKEVANNPTWLDDYYAQYYDGNPMVAFEAYNQSPDMRHGLWCLMATTEIATQCCVRVQVFQTIHLR